MGTPLLGVQPILPPGSLNRFPDAIPPHQHVDTHKLHPDEVPVARMLEFIIAKHPESYRAYVRAY